LEKKVTLVTKNNLAGMAIWALGYEGGSILSPLQRYKANIVDITRL
jgi:spore germination protein YaaH